jgi:pimeloyl-ACP methyl ester carboxylesterase
MARKQQSESPQQQDMSAITHSTPHDHLTADEAQQRAPNALLLALEWRALWEFAALVPAIPLLKTAARGDGHPVLVFPGLAANDVSTLPMRLFLADRGFRAYPWNFGFNTGPKTGVLQGCVEHIRELSDHHGGQKVSVVGWSLGGLYAREAAKRIPDRVRNVITLGTPFTGNPLASNARWLFELLSGMKVGDPALHRQLRAAPPVPSTSFYSRTDGVVHWQCSLQTEGEQTENVEVPASHFGLGLNPITLYALADRLAQPDGAWQKFDRAGIKRFLYR